MTAQRRICEKCNVIVYGSRELEADGYRTWWENHPCFPMYSKVRNIIKKYKVPKDIINQNIEKVNEYFKRGDLVMKNEFKTADELEERAIQITRTIFKSLRLDHSDYRTELLFNKNTRALLAAELLEVYKQGWDDRTLLGL